MSLSEQDGVLDGIQRCRQSLARQCSWNEDGNGVRD